MKTKNAYTAEVEVTGTAPLVFDRWVFDESGLPSRKPEDLVYRLKSGHIALPGDYLRYAMLAAARFVRELHVKKSRLKAAVEVLTPLADMGRANWDYLHRSNPIIPGLKFSRTRPAFKKGWKAVFKLRVNEPEFIDRDRLYEVIRLTGRVIGLGMFRPTYGRFNISRFRQGKAGTGEA